MIRRHIETLHYLKYTWSWKTPFLPKPLTAFTTWYADSGRLLSCSKTMRVPSESPTSTLLSHTSTASIFFCKLCRTSLLEKASKPADMIPLLHWLCLGNLIHSVGVTVNLDCHVKSCCSTVCHYCCPTQSNITIYFPRAKDLFCRNQRTVIGARHSTESAWKPSLRGYSYWSLASRRTWCLRQSRISTQNYMSGCETKGSSCFILDDINIRAYNVAVTNRPPMPSILRMAM